MSNFDEENQENQENLNELELPINRQILSFLQLGIEQFNLILDNIPLIRNDTFFEEEDNSRLFPLTRLQLGRDRLSPREQAQNIQKYLQKRTIPIQNYKFDPRQPHIKVTQLRNINKNHQYFINEFGLIDSQKNTNSIDILIGRQYRQNKDIIPNDIILPEDRVISRLHCKIVCNDYFRKDQILDPLYAKILKVINLPSSIKFRISQFFEQPKIVQIQDLGSICGTYLRIFRQKPFLLQQDQKFSIGSDTCFNIIFNHRQNLKLKQIDEQWYSIIKHLSTLKYPKNMKFILVMINFSPVLKNLLNQQRISRLMNFIKSQVNTKYLYQLLNSLVKEYSLIGPLTYFQGQFRQILWIFLQEEEVKMIQRSIQIQYQENNVVQSILKTWIINDGLYDRDSANGTWISLQTAEQSEQKIESNLIEIHHNDEIKISDFILKLELFKGTKEGIGHIINNILHD
ncbi:unnamed protein product [Paramecium primaurelia]|uniref:FHA domain-containing protein n=1 Tax=Paramecium primaurelia TaxID=5886 RepID=A0A8S1JYK4_PARPR|nr:unnamed protein product [Paramecium primaurelia]